MPVISRKTIRRPRKVRFCSTCDAKMEGPQVRLYGYAETGDPKYAIHVCEPCNKRDLEREEARRHYIRTGERRS